MESESVQALLWRSVFQSHSRGCQASRTGILRCTSLIQLGLIERYDPCQTLQQKKAPIMVRGQR